MHIFVISLHQIVGDKKSNGKWIRKIKESWIPVEDEMRRKKKMKRGGEERRGDEDGKEEVRKRRGGGKEDEMKMK